MNKFVNTHDKSYACQKNLIFSDNIKNGVSIYMDRVSLTKYVGKAMDRNRLMYEKKILDICKGCPYIIDNCFTETIDNKPAIMMPFFQHGDLYSACQKILIPSQIKRISLQVLHALQYMHQRSIMHRDIKPANIVLANNSYYFDVKVIDFGLAVVYDANSPPTDQVGTVNYAAPEIIKKEAQSPKSDIWSFGIMIYAITTLKVPFRVDSNFDVSSISYHHKIFQTNPLLVEFLKSIFKINPQERPSAEKLLDHDWLK